ncbi:MAG: hypothetical protein IJ397_06365 [Lachnospiraceae bacterium]|nr:hypothetical protein [Lachnospiraceae bacterium]
MNHNHKYTFGDILISIIFIIWFIGSIVAMVFFARSGMPALAIGVFGQYFLVFGIAAIVSGIKNKNFNPIVLIFPIVGIVAIVGSCIYQFGSEVMMDMVEKSIPYLILGVFFIVGMILVIVAFRIAVGQKNRCTEPVVATCVEVLEKYSVEGGQLLCPVYEINYGMNKIQICNNVYMSDRDVCVGDCKDLYINPDNPQEFYEGKIHLKTAFVVGGLGVFFMGMSILAIYMVLFG